MDFLNEAVLHLQTNRMEKMKVTLSARTESPLLLLLLMLNSTFGIEQRVFYSNLVSAQIHARSVGPVLQSSVSQFHGGRLYL